MQPVKEAEVYDFAIYFSCYHGFIKVIVFVF